MAPVSQKSPLFEPCITTQHKYEISGKLELLPYIIQMIFKIVRADEITIETNFVWNVQITSLMIFLYYFTSEMSQTKVINVVIFPAFFQLFPSKQKVKRF